MAENDPYTTLDQQYALTQKNMTGVAPTGLTQPQTSAPADADPYTKLDQDYAGQTDPNLYKGDNMDHWYSTSAIGRALDAFGIGVKSGWGPSQLGLSPESIEGLRKAGIFNDYQHGENNLWKSFSEGLGRPAITIADALLRTVPAVLGGVQGEISHFSPAAGEAFGTGVEAATDPGLAMSLEGIPIAPLQLLGGMVGEAQTLLRTPLTTAAAAARAAETAAGLGAPGALAEGLRSPITALRAGIQEYGNAARARALNTMIEGRSLGVIGEGDAGWQGYADDTQALRRTDAIREQSAIQESTPAAETPLAEPTNMHDSLARYMEPDLFAKYDPLTIERNTLTEKLGDWHTTTLDQMDANIDRLRGERLEAPPRERPELANNITALENERQDFADHISHGPETPDITAAREQLSDVHSQLADLSPQVSKAYRDADAQIRQLVPERIFSAESMRPTEHPPEPTPAEPTPPTTEETTAPVEAAQPETQPAVAAVRAPPSQAIAADVSKQLVAAKRPIEEADITGALVAARYQAVAEMFQGVKGTADDLYRDRPIQVTFNNRLTTTRGRHIDPVGDAQRIIELGKVSDASTFGHELGHSMLLETLSDAKDTDAPQQLRDDAMTINKWLGTDVSEPLPARTDPGYKAALAVSTKAQERFARGFETYLMEGRAPSPELAGVFDKFKGWLTTIYQTLKNLKSPLTDDIRGVFDRMLAAPEHPTVVTPETKQSLNFAAGDQLAARVPPEDLSSTAAHIEEEAHATQQREPEIAAELDARESARRAGQTSGGPGTPERPVGNAAGTEPLAGTTGTPEPSNPIGLGGGQAAPESGAARGGTTAAADTTDTGRSERVEPATGEQPGTGTAANADAERSAAADIPRPNSRLVDHTGSIVVDNITTPTDVNSAIRQAAEIHGEFPEQRRNSLTDAEVQNLSEALGLSARMINHRLIGKSWNVDEVIEAVKMLKQSAVAVKDAAAKAADGSDADVLAFAKARDRHAMMQAEISRIRAPAAAERMQAYAGVKSDKAGAGQSIEESAGQSIVNLQREARVLNQLSTTLQVGKNVIDSQKTGFSDWLLSYYINALISGPATHGTYLVGNQLLALGKMGETALASGFGRAREAGLFGSQMATDAERVRLGEVVGESHGMFYGTRKGLSAAWEAMKTNETQLLPGEQVPQSSALHGLGKVIPNPEIAGVEIPIGKTLEMPSRVVTAIHAFSRTVGYEQSIWGQARRIAISEGRSGYDFTARYNDLGSNPTEAMMQRAIADANDMTLMRRPVYGSIGQRLSGVVNYPIAIPYLGTLRPIKFLDPFITISNNLFDQALMQRTPLGWASPRIRDDLLGRNGGVAFDRAAGRMLAGTSFMIGMGSLAAAGLVSGSGPADPKQYKAWIQAGNQPYSIKIGDMWYSTHRLGVYGMLAGVAADMWEFAHTAATEDLGTVAAMAAHAFGNDILDESFARGPADMIKAMEDSQRAGPAFIRNLVSSFVPFSVGMSQIARQIDPYTRQTRSTMDAIMAKIPFESETLQPKRDIWGEPIPNRSSLVPGLLAIYESRVNNDPVNRVLQQLAENSLTKYYPAAPTRKIRDVPLDDQQYDDYSRLAGRMAKKQLDMIVAMPGFDTLAPALQHDLIAAAIKASREYAEAVIMMQNPGIIRQAIANKRILYGQTH